MNNLETTLIDLVHEYGFMTVEDTLKNAVLEQSDLNDPYVFMTKLLKSNTLNDIIYHDLYDRTSKRKYKSLVISDDTDDDTVYKIVQIDNFFYRINGYEDSYSTPIWTSWKVVTPTQKTITVYE